MLRDRLHALFRDRFGLQLDEPALGRIEALAQRQAEAERLDPWLAALREAEPSAVPVRAAISVVTNGQTYFMRDRPQLQAVEEWLLRRFRELRRTLHVWSAGCSSGEEAYTLAMLGARLGVPLQILASDVNAEAVERARRAVYSEWPLRHVAPEERAGCFVAVKDGFEVAPRIRKAVSFCVHNLATASPLVPEKTDRLWDAIVCRNVLIYFDLAARGRTLERFESVLPDEGALVLASGESLRGLMETKLKPRQLAGAFVFVREAKPKSAGDNNADLAAAYASVVRRVSTVPPAPASIPPEGFPEHTRTNIKPLLDAGNRMLREHSFFSALDQYADAIRLDGLAFEPYLLTAIVQLKQGLFGEAKASLRSALFLEPQLWSAEYLMAGIHAREERRLEQRASLSRAENLLIRIEPEPALVSDTTGIEPLCYNREQALAVCRSRLKSTRKGIL
ncbi:MAG: CheR family methyltransferase [Myxococcales bacterium]